MDMLSLPGRHRVCAAIIRGDEILMVRHRDAARTYWTLPGGGVEPGETPEAAAVREVQEETDLDAVVIRFLFRAPYSAGVCDCFLCRLTDPTQIAALGHDPEDAHLPAGERLLQQVAWLPLSEMQEDGQVQAVLAHILT